MIQIPEVIYIPIYTHTSYEFFKCGGFDSRHSIAISEPDSPS